MSRFILHTKVRGRKYRTYIMAGCACVLVAGIFAYAAHSIGMAGAKSRETVLIYTEEELEQYLLDQESEEYNMNGIYRLEVDLNLSWLETSIGNNLEPFTGEFDGNGHVIGGLVRPLFGVTERAEIENLYLEQAEIIRPCTYSDGERYVDGYAALVAYAKDTVIKNCGMSGTIGIASPSEAEYQIAKASPPDAEEQRGPGVEVAAGIDEHESLTESEIVEKGPGITDGEETEAGTFDSMETGGESGRIDGTTEEGGPSVSLEENESGMDSSSDGEGGMGSSTESDHGADASKENDNGLDTSKESDNGTDTSTESDNGTDTSTENENGTDASTENENGLDISKESENGADASKESENGTDASTENENGADISTESEKNTKLFSEGEKHTESSTEKESIKSYTNSVTSGRKPAETLNTADQITLEPETIGYLPIDRFRLTMKVPAVTDLPAESVLPASPADASPSDAEEPSDGETIPRDHPSSPEAETEEYIGNPAGDIFILVTAERAAAGGLVAQTAGSTLLSNCFTLAAISSQWDDGESYAGGMAGILGEGACVENSYTSGLVDCFHIIAGFAAVNEGTIQNCYSTTTVSREGAVRGAFTAVENGCLTGCVYDRQMACVEEPDRFKEVSSPATAAEAEKTDAEFALKAMNTKDITGDEAQIPGNWYMTAQAYPQIPYFAEHGQAVIATESKVSVIALMLPGELTLEDVLKGGEILLPFEVDGQEIIWDAEGNAVINGDHQVVLEPKAAYSEYEVPKVQSALSGEEAAAPEESGQPAQTDGTGPSDAKEEKVRLKASVGTVSRSFTLQLAAPRDTAYTDWSIVGAEIDASGSIPDGGGTKENPYLIRTAEELAWFAYKVNTGNVNICARLENSIDLFGTKYTNVEYAYDTATGTDNIDSALLWIPIGMTPFEGIFDGNGNYVEHLRTYETRKRETGFVSYLKGSGVIKNLGVASGKIVSTIVNAGGIVGRVYDRGKVQNCWNGATVECFAEGMAGGIVGFTAHSEENGIIIEGCYNRGVIKGSASVGGIMGGAWKGTTVRDCYNEGSVSGTTRVGGITGVLLLTGNDSGNPNKSALYNCYNYGEVIGTSAQGGICGYYPGGVVSNCYYLENTLADTNGRKLTDQQLKSWAAAYALNGQSMTGAWKYELGKYPQFGTLSEPDSWETVGQGVIDQLITGKTAPTDGGTGIYSIDSAEQLAVFAIMVNSGDVRAKGVLTEDIDMAGTAYGGTNDVPVLWKPMGTSAQAYKGSFAGDRHVISHLNVEQVDYAGVFGAVEEEGQISEVSIANSSITGGTAGGITGILGGNAVISKCYMNGGTTVTSNGATASCAGGIAGQLTGNAVISQCYSRGGNQVTAGGTTAYAGGIVGQIRDHAAVRDSYHLDSKVSGTGSTAYAGGIAGDGGTDGTVENCYSACRAAAASVPITAAGTGKAGSIAGTGGTISRCYSETLMSGDPSAVVKFDLTSNEKIWQQTDGINTVGETERTGDARVWFTSLASETTRGLPTFTAPVIVPVTLAPAATSAGTTGNLVPAAEGAVLRGIRQDKKNSAVFTFPAASEVSRCFHTYGSTSANTKIGLKADNTDIGPLAASLTNAGGNAGSIGTLSRLTLYTGAAYTVSTDQLLLIDAADNAGQRYEIQVTVKGVTSKTLSVTMPVKVTMAELTPDGTDHTVAKGTAQYSADLKITNKNDYPIDGKILKAAVNDATGYAPLRPVLPSYHLSNTGYLTDAAGGVRLGLADASGTSPAVIKAVKYCDEHAAAGTSWMEYRLKNKGSLPYRYVMEYSGLHFGPDTQFEYQISYWFGVSADDYEEVAEAVVSS